MRYTLHLKEGYVLSMMPYESTTKAINQFNELIIIIMKITVFKWYSKH